MKRILLLFVFFSLLTGSLWMKISAHRSIASMPVIIDTDVDMDDAMAILFLIKSKMVDIKAITTTGSGMVSHKYSVKNIMKITELCDAPSIPVAYGALESLNAHGEFPVAWREHVDQMMSMDLPENPEPPAKLASDDLIIQIVKNSKEKVTLLCLGPLTNIAHALRKDPSIKENINRIYMMGGALYVPGNVIGITQGNEHKHSEYNIFLDVTAASEVFSSGIPIKLVPLDATNFVSMEKNRYIHLSTEKSNKVAAFVSEVIDRFIQSQSSVAVYFWDPLAACLMVNPKICSICKFIKVKVNCVKGPDFGRIEISDEGDSIEACVEVDSDLFYKCFFEVINKN